MNQKILISRETAGKIRQLFVTACEKHLLNLGSAVISVAGTTGEGCHYCLNEARAEAVAHAARQKWFSDLMPSDTIYISGPMTGYENFNRPAFWRMENVLHLAGCRVLSPAHYQDGASYETLMRLGFQMVLDASALVLLRGWDKSNGACDEVRVANVIGTKVYYEN